MDSKDIRNLQEAYREVYAEAIMVNMSEEWRDSIIG
jgi:hypothetical protein